MNEEILHNFPSFIEKVQTLTEERQHEEPASKPDLPCQAKLRTLYQMVDGKMPERKVLATPQAAPTQPGGGAMNALQTAFRFITGQI